MKFLRGRPFLAMLLASILAVLVIMSEHAIFATIEMPHGILLIFIFYLGYAAARLSEKAAPYPDADRELDDDEIICDFNGDRCTRVAHTYCDGCETWRCDDHECDCEVNLTDEEVKP